MQTLKDVHNSLHPKDIHSHDDCCLEEFIEELRATAIGWVVKMNELDNNGKGNYDLLDSEFDEFSDFVESEFATFTESRNWIIHFFNITQEEIKNATRSKGTKGSS
jgi:hypothetical protein